NYSYVQDPNSLKEYLKLSQVADGAGHVLDTRYYRSYMTGDANGYGGGLKYAFGPQSYARLVAALGSNVDGLTDAQVAPYADAFFQYDNYRRVTQAVIQGAGCTSCSGGLGTYTYQYSSSTAPSGNNNWGTSTIETLPDGSTTTVYTNFLGQVLLTD